MTKHRAIPQAAATNDNGYLGKPNEYTYYAKAYYKG
jgi:hypothetical protein